MTSRKGSSAEDWPVDSDVSSEDLAPARPEHLKLQARRVAVVLAGGFVGGLTRYEAITHWATASGTFPWATFVVNTAGAFVLGLLIIVVLDVIGPSTYARPLIGAGFCGALTTFSSVAVAVDEFIAHNHVGLGFGYLAASLAAGLAAVAVGAWLGRQLPPTNSRRASANGAG
jgi:fluoride exporter